MAHEGIDCPIAGTFNERIKNFARINKLIREKNNEAAANDEKHPPILDHNFMSTLSVEQRKKMLGLKSPT